MRLIEADGGWWCAGAGGRVAFLPREAVRDGVVVEEALAHLNGRGFFEERERPFGLTVLTATACNLGCGYCFQNTARSERNPFAPVRMPKAVLTSRTARRVARFTRERMEALGKEELSLLIFGGEPLLNPPGCLAVLAELGSLNLVDAGMTSNAVLLEPRLAARLKDAGLDWVQVSFDGAREEHDGTRYDRRGGPTYDTILGNLARCRDSGLAWRFRINVSHVNVDGIGRVIDDLAEVATGQLALSFVDDVGIGYENALTYSDELAGRFVALVDQAMDRGFAVPARLASLADCVYCGEVAGGSGAVVNADGTLSSCWDTAGRAEWVVGDLERGYDEGVEGRWVACGHGALPHGDEVGARRFHDRVNGHILWRTHLVPLVGL